MTAHPNAWPRAGRRRKTGILALAVLVHAGGLLALWHLRAVVDRPVRIVETTVLALPAPRPRVRPVPSVAPDATPARRPPPLIAPRLSETRPREAPVAVVAAPPASAASAPPLQLTLSPRQLRELEATQPRSLAQTLQPAGPAVSPFERMAAADARREERRPDGSIDVHEHGSCYKVTKGAGQLIDPIGHAHDVFVGSCDR